MYFRNGGFVYILNDVVVYLNIVILCKIMEKLANFLHSEVWNFECEYRS